MSERKLREKNSGRRHLSPALYPFWEKHFCNQTLSEDQFPFDRNENCQIGFQLNGIGTDYLELQKG